jgi:hypothetical protein
MSDTPAGTELDAAGIVARRGMRDATVISHLDDGSKSNF